MFVRFEAKSVCFRFMEVFGCFRFMKLTSAGEGLHPGQPTRGVLHQLQATLQAEAIIDVPDSEALSS